MEEYIRITENTLHWFLTLLPEQEVQAMRKERMIYAIGAVSEKTACGVLVFQIDNEIAEIRYLAVADSFRRKGIATGMIQYLCRHAWESVTPVICTFSASGYEDELYRFFRSLDTFTVTQEEGFYCTIPLAKLASSPLSAMGKRKVRYQEFFSLPLTVRRRFFSDMLEKKIYFLREIREEEFIKSLCLCNIAESDVKAAIFVTGKGEQGTDFELSCAWCLPGQEAQLIGLLAQAGERIPRDGDGNLRIAAVTPTSVSIVNRLLPDRVITDYFFRAVWDMEL